MPFLQQQNTAKNFEKNTFKTKFNKNTLPTMLNSENNKLKPPPPSYENVEKEIKQQQLINNGINELNLNDNNSLGYNSTWQPSINSAFRKAINKNNDSSFVSIYVFLNKHIFLLFYTYNPCW